MSASHHVACPVVTRRARHAASRRVVIRPRATSGPEAGPSPNQPPRHWLANGQPERHPESPNQTGHTGSIDEEPCYLRASATPASGATPLLSTSKGLP